MKKKTYMMPLVCVYAIETSTFLAGSNDNNQAKPARLGFSFGEGGDKITSGDDEDVWE